MEAKLGFPGLFTDFFIGCISLKQNMAAEVAHVPLSEMGSRKRKFGAKKSGKGKKKMRVVPSAEKKVKISQKMKKLFRKRAREYNSDDDDENGEEEGRADQKPERRFSSEEAHDKDMDSVEVDEDFSDGEADEIQPGIANFSDGSRVFKMAFKSVMKNAVADDLLVSYLMGIATSL